MVARDVHRLMPGDHDNPTTLFPAPLSLRPAPTPAHHHAAPNSQSTVQRVEALGRALASHGAPVFFQPTTAHRHAAGPVTMLCLIGALTASGGLLAPLPGIVALLGLLLAAIKDADGGQSWLRRLLPRRPGWTAEIELQGGAPDQPTLLLWAPVVGRAYGRLPAGRLARALMAVPAGLGALACLGLALSSRLAPGLGSGLALGSAAGLVVCALIAALLLRPSKRLGLDAEPAEWIPPLAHRLARRPLAGVRLLVLIGSEGAVWCDDLAITLRSRRHRYNPHQTMLLAVEPGPGPLAIVDHEGLVIARPAPTQLLSAFADLALPTTPGRTGAARARALGLPAVGLLGIEARPGQGAEVIEQALRSLAGRLAPEHQ